jgi:hypothetical protein
MREVNGVDGNFLASVSRPTSGGRKLCVEPFVVAEPV